MCLAERTGGQFRGLDEGWCCPRPVRLPPRADTTERVVVLTPAEVTHKLLAMDWLTWIVNHPLGASFLGSFVAGLVLLASSPIWWGTLKRAIDAKTLQRTLPLAILLVMVVGSFAVLVRIYELPPPGDFVPPSDFSKQDTAQVRTKCQLEAMREMGPPTSSRLFDSLDHNHAVNRYVLLCLQREGFSYRGPTD